MPSTTISKEKFYDTKSKLLPVGIKSRTGWKSALSVYALMKCCHRMHVSFSPKNGGASIGYSFEEKNRYLFSHTMIRGFQNKNAQKTTSFKRGIVVFARFPLCSHSCSSLNFQKNLRTLMSKNVGRLKVDRVQKTNQVQDKRSLLSVSFKRARDWPFRLLFIYAKPGGSFRCYFLYIFLLFLLYYNEAAFNALNCIEHDQTVLCCFTPCLMLWILI